MKSPTSAQEIASESTTAETGYQSFEDHYFAASSLQMTLALMFSPTTKLVRAVDHVDLREEHVSLRTVLDVSATSEYFLVPVATVRRDQLIDTLQIESDDGVTPIVLGERATVAVVRQLLLASAEAAAITQLDPQLVRRLCKKVPSEERAKAVELVSAFRSALIATNGALTPAQNELVALLHHFCTYRPLLVPCRASDGVLRLRYSRDLSHNEFRWTGLREGLRSSFGRLPDELYFDLPLATRASSYHFRLNAPELHYVASADCYRRVGRALRQQVHVRAWEIEPFVPDATATVLGAQPSADGVCHICIRGAADARLATNGLLLRVRVTEQPFGQLGEAAMRLALVLLASYGVWKYGKNLVAFPGTGLSSIVLALPGLLGASFFVTRPTTGTRGPLVARIGSIAAALGAILLSVVLAGWTTAAARSRFLNPKDRSTTFEAPGWAEAALRGQGLVVALLLLACLILLAANIVSFSKAERRYRRKPRVTI